MAEHSLAVHNFHTHVALTGLREDASPLGREVGRAVSEILPAAVGRFLEPLLGSREGVLRIDRLALRLRLGRGELSAVRIADLIARELARAVSDRAENRSAEHHIGAGLAFWPDHASYAASYLAYRLRLAPAPDWAFPDLRALAHLAPHEAAVELIAARPGVLAALARLIGPAAAPLLAASLPEQTAALLIEQLVSELPFVLPADAEAVLAAMIAALRVAAPSEPARAAIVSAVAALAADNAEDAADVRQIVMLARLAVALAALRSATYGWGREPVAGDLAPEALVHLPEPARRLAQAALAPLSQAPSVRTGLLRLLDPARRHTSVSEAALAHAAEAAAPSRAIASRFAGIGLLMPSVLAHGLPDLLSPVALHRTLAAAFGPEVEGAARLDPLVATLAPFDPRGPEAMFPPVPDPLRNVVPETRRDGEAAAEGAGGWAACLIHDFAAGLSGFEASSLGYLRRQFLMRPGTLHIADGRLTLVLDPLPLGIVLRRSGMHGWTGRLPQANGALLRIEIRED